MDFTDEQKRRINNEIMTKANPKLMATASTLCWLCKHCTGGRGCPCCKTMEGKPVEGWKAEDSKLHPGEAWCVKECPLFDFNYGLRWELPTVMPLLKQWCKTASGKELYYNAIIRDPYKWIDAYNAQMPRDCQIDPMIDDEYGDGEDNDDEEFDALPGGILSSEDIGDLHDNSDTLEALLKEELI